MKRKYKNTFIIAALLLMAAAPPTEAQILKKLGQAAKEVVKKGVDDVKKNASNAVDNATDILTGRTIKSSDKLIGDGKNNSSTATVSTSGTETTTQAAETAAQEKGGGGQSWPDCPAITIDFDGYNWGDVTSVSDGVFAICVPRRQGKCWRFYHVKTGQAVCPERMEWGFPLGKPRFNGGVCAVRDTVPASGSGWSAKYRWYILKKTGERIALDPKIKAVSNFCDGLAVAEADGERTKFFINDRGERVLTALKMNTFEVFPLVENLRIFRNETGKYGYIDGSGRVVIEAKYSNVRNFSNNHALVADEHYKWLLINLEGKMVASVPDVYLGWSGASVTDFVQGFAVARNKETDRYDIVNTSFQPQATYDHATAIFNSPIGEKATAFVRNREWKHPQRMAANGKLLGDFFLTRKRANGQEAFVEPVIDAAPDMPTPQLLQERSFWVNTGLWIAYNVLTDNHGALFDSEGHVLWEFLTNYYSIESYSSDGYAKAVVHTHEGTRDLALIEGATAEVTKSHTAFIDTQGRVMVEIIDKSN